MLAYESAVQELYRLGHELHQSDSYKFDLKHMRVLAEALGSPQTRFPSVLIAGTNGKGSTAAVLASIVQAAGYRTGLYTSPHLLRINERIRVDGEPISDADFAEGYECVHAAAKELVAGGRLPAHPSFFETITALAFRHFASQRVDIVVAEVGMGGRLDATNILEPLVSVITDIDLDHQKFLGNTVGEIAAEKAGIMRRGRPLVTLPQHPEANQTLGRAMEELGAIGVSAAQYVPPFPHADSHPSGSEKTVAGDPGSGEADTGDKSALQRAAGTGDGSPSGSRRAGFALEIMGEEVVIETTLLGRHQLRNLALAISAAEELGKQGFAISPRQIAEGIRRTRWPGRFQIVAAELPHQVESGLAGGPELSPEQGKGGLAGDRRAGRPEMVIDVAHNPAGAWALRAALSEQFLGQGGEGAERKLIMVYGAMRDKAIREVGRILFPLAEKVVLTKASGNPRAASTAELREAIGDCGTTLIDAANVADAVRLAMAEAQPFGASALLVITGSIYVVGEAMQALGVRT